MAEPRKIITVDDEADIRRLIKRMLEKEGYIVDEAADAKEGWDKISVGGYDLVLLDIMMPGMSPHEFVRYLQGAAGVDPDLGKTRVVFVSAIPLPQPEKEKITSQKQVSGYLEKPFTKEKLLEKVRQALDAGKNMGSQGEEAKDEQTEKPKLTVGSIYLIEQNNPAWSIKLLQQEKNNGKSGLIITRTNPNQLVEKHGLTNVAVYWLTDAPAEKTDTICGLQNLSLLINGFISEHGPSAILLDGLEYLIVNNDFHLVLKFIQHMRDRVAATGSVMLIPINPSAINQQNLTQLESECQRLP